jgi:hypothetical protein
VKTNKGNFCLIGQFLRLRNCPIAIQMAGWLRSKGNELCVSFRIYCIYLWKYYFRDIQEKVWENLPIVGLLCVDFTPLCQPYLYQGCAQWAHTYKYLSVIPEKIIPFACAFMTFIIFPLPSWLRKHFYEISKLSGRLPTFVKQGVGAKNGKKVGCTVLFGWITSKDINNII